MKKGKDKGEKNGNRAWKGGREKEVKTRKGKGVVRRKGIRIGEKERNQLALPYFLPTFHYCLCYPCVAGSCLPLLSGGGGGGGGQKTKHIKNFDV